MHVRYLRFFKIDVPLHSSEYRCKRDFPFDFSSAESRFTRCTLELFVLHSDTAQLGFSKSEIQQHKQGGTCRVLRIFLYKTLQACSLLLS